METSEQSEFVANVLQNAASQPPSGGITVMSEGGEEVIVTLGSASLESGFNLDELEVSNYGLALDPLDFLSVNFPSSIPSQSGTGESSADSNFDSAATDDNSGTVSNPPSNDFLQILTSTGHPNAIATASALLEPSIQRADLHDAPLPIPSTNASKP